MLVTIPKILKFVFKYCAKKNFVLPAWKFKIYEILWKFHRHFRIYAEPLINFIKRHHIINILVFNEWKDLKFKIPKQLSKYFMCTLSSKLRFVIFILFFSPKIEKVAIKIVLHIKFQFKHIICNIWCWRWQGMNQLSV